jgi:hypothetical protein
MHTATYDATGKEIKSNGNSGTSNSGPAGTTSNASYNDYGSFETVLPPLQGNPVFTVSGWFKQNTIANLQIPWLIGRDVRITASPGSGQNTKMSWFGVESNGRPRIAIGGGGNLELYYTSGSIQAGRWHHMVITVQPSGTSTVAGDVTFYLDGASQSTSSTSGSSGDIDLGGGAPPRMHWFWQESTTVYYDGSASNIKVYDTALTAGEVKTLYDMGRMGGEANPQRLHIAAPLDVRGDIHGGCPVYFQALYNANLQAARYDVAPYGTLIPFNKVFEHKGDCFDTSTGLFTAPIDGLYSFGYSVRKRGGSYDDFWTYIQKNGSPLNGTNNSPGRVYVASSTSGPESVFASQRFILDLSAGDTVGVIIATVNGLNAQISNGYNSFHGYYVGRGNGSFGSYSY